MVRVYHLCQFVATRINTYEFLQFVAIIQTTIPVFPVLHPRITGVAPKLLYQKPQKSGLRLHRLVSPVVSLVIRTTLHTDGL